MESSRKEVVKVKMNKLTNRKIIDLVKKYKG